MVVKKASWVPPYRKIFNHHYFNYVGEYSNKEFANMIASDFYRYGDAAHVSKFLDKYVVYMRRRKK